MGTGKSSVAVKTMFALRQNYGHDATIASFADALKAFVSSVYGVELHLFYSPEGKNSVPSWVPDLPFSMGPFDVPPLMVTKMPPSFSKCVKNVELLDKEIISKCLEVARSPDERLTCGRLLQIVGEAFRSVVDPNFWIDRLKEHIDFKAVNVKTVIIDDVRHDNEADWIIKNGGTVYVLESKTPAPDLCVAGRSKAHPSEAGLFGQTKGIVTLEVEHSNQSYQDAAMTILRNHLITSSA